MIEIPRLRGCCCGCTVETGAMILAWLCVIGSTISTLTSIASSFIYLTDGQDIIKESPNEDPLGKKVDLMHLKIMIAVQLISSLVSAVLNYLLLIGIYKRNFCLMTPWIVLNAIGLVIMYTAAVILFFVALFVKFQLVIAAFLIMIVGCLPTYFYLVIFTHYRQLKEEKQSNDTAFKPI